MTYKFGGLDLESPLVNAAGSINSPSSERLVQETELLASTAIGAITLGSFTIPPQEGNEARYGSPVYYHDKKTRTTYNSMGLPNIGKDSAVALAPELVMRAHDQGKPVIYSGSPTNAPEHGSSVDQAVRLAYDFLSTQVDLVEINVSCPNVVTEGGGRKPIMGYDLETIEELEEALFHMVGTNQRLGIKLPPYISPEEKILIPDIAKRLRARNVFKFVVTANTIGNQIPVDEAGKPILKVPEGKGGKSGPATQGEGRQQLVLWHSQVGDSMDIISTLGLDGGKDLALRRRLGATAAGGVTFLWESNNWGHAVSRMLDEYNDYGAF